MNTPDFLSSIRSPEDIRSFTIPELETLASQMRARIIEVLSEKGGHLASNLGVVELTIALHKVFNSPKDKFIWDVSHQTYTHKLLTGRAQQFDQIFHAKGICGFSHPEESPHDHFQAGHAGTALSLALGVAHSRDLDKQSEYVVPVIGDATLTCGLALEALNNLPPKLKKFIVILNDNAMSISKNVGAITHILSRMISNPTIHRIYQQLDSIVSKIPSVGSSLSKQGKKITGSLKNLVSPALFFEQYGLSYIGPVDGHDIEKLVDIFERLKDSEWPVLVHVVTQKGKGMEKAIESPDFYHGAKPFDRTTGEFIKSTSSKLSFPKIFGRELLQMARKDPDIVAVTPAMTLGSSLTAFEEEFPDRCLDVGIAEGHAVTFCGGLAYKGKKKVLSVVYATFLQRALDNLFHDVCLQELPVVFAIDRAGLAGYGGTHHGIYDISFLNAMPNMILSQPRNGDVLKDLLHSAFNWGRPAAIRYPNLPTEEDLKRVPVYREPGKGEILEKGSDVLLIPLGHMEQVAHEAREILAKEGIFPTIFDPVFLKPLDFDSLCELLGTHSLVVTIEEHSAVGGLGTIVNNFIQKNGFKNVQVLNFGVPEKFVGHGPLKELYKEIGLTAPQVAKKVLEQLAVSSYASV